MKINQFYGCTSADEVQLRFDDLSKVFADQDEILQILKSEYSTLMNVLTESESTTVEIVKEKSSLSEKIKELQEKVKQEGLRLEIVGQWLWLSGATFAIKDVLKALDFRYSPDKKSWYWRSDENRSSNEKPIPLEMIREKYGTNVVAL
jgi:2-hydroxy-3-keto-5-methylthiopentenyl-1-phosphate phosphatase